MPNRLQRNVQLLVGNRTIAANVEVALGHINCNNIRTATATVRLTYNASATAGGTLKLYYSPDGQNFDTVTYTSYAIDFTANTTQQETKILDLPEQGYVAFHLDNDDATYEITQCSLWITIARWGDVYIEGDKLIEQSEQQYRKRTSAAYHLPREGRAGEG